MGGDGRRARRAAAWGFWLSAVLLAGTAAYADPAEQPNPFEYVQIGGEGFIGGGWNVGGPWIGGVGARFGVAWPAVSAHIGGRMLTDARQASIGTLELGLRAFPLKTTQVRGFAGAGGTWGARLLGIGESPTVAGGYLEAGAETAADSAIRLFAALRLDIAKDTSLTAPLGLATLNFGVVIGRILP